MWHPEDGGEYPGDDGPEAGSSGPLPDPETRHWRHPSELARHHALPHPDPTPLPSIPLRGSPMAVWPLMAVGGCLAVAAVGFLSMQNGLVTSTAIQAGPTATVLPEWAIGLPSVTAGASGGETSDTEPPASTDGQALSLPDVSTTITTADLEFWELMANRRPTTAPGATVGPEVTSPPIQAEIAQAPVYGVYTQPDDEDGLLASFTVIADELVTSAAAIDGRPQVWIRVGASWLEATVAATDPLTDLALLDVAAPGGGADVLLPSLPMADEGIDPVDPGDPVMIGYGDVEAPTPSTKQDSDLPDTGEWLAASDRRGKVYAVGAAVSTRTDHLLQDPIRAAIDPQPGDAGAPLRDRQGRLIGLTVSANSPQVTAIPIDRVIETVAALRQFGAGDGVWLGVELGRSDDGVVIDEVDDDGPADALRPGDRIIAVDGRIVSHPDQFWYAAREAGPGGSLIVTVERWHRWRALKVDVAARPPADQSD